MHRPRIENGRRDILGLERPKAIIVLRQILTLHFEGVYEVAVDIGQRGACD